VKDGVDVQEISFDVNKLAKRDVWQSKGFASTTSSVADRDTTLTLNLDGTDYAIDVKAGTTLEQLRDQINETTEGKIEASILNTGGETPYSLVLKSRDTGAEQAITATFDDGDPDTSDDDFLELSNVQTAQDAEFVYNGVTITRPTNTVDDLIPGVTFELLKADTTNTVKISQDKEGIADTVQTFIDTYNSWIQAMNDATKFDEDAGTVGIFQGESAIRQLKTDVTRALFGVTPEGLGVANYGISVDEDGLISFDRSTFMDALETDGERLADTFSDENHGVFAKLNRVLAEATDPLDGSLALLDQQYKRDDHWNQSQ
jgi:flagellar hook-associated protein 2